MTVILLCIVALAVSLGAWQLLRKRRTRNDLKGMVATMPVIPVTSMAFVPRPSMSPPTASTPNTTPSLQDPAADDLVHSLSLQELEALPFYLRPGHGFILLLDCCLDRLEIDAIDVGHPHHSHAHRDVDFRGYFNVTPGTHTLVAHWQGRSTTQIIDVAPDRVYVMRLNWAQGGWVEVPANIAAAQGALTMSLLETRRLQPWPLPSLYFLNPPQPLWVNGRYLPITEFGGLIDMPPGNVHIRAGRQAACWALPPKCMQVVTFENGEPELLDPRVSAVVVSRELRTARRGALISHAELLAQQDVDPSLFDDAPAANDPVDDIFDMEDLDYFDEMFEQYRLQGPDALTNYVAVLHAHYVADTSMAYQEEFFEGYAERAYAHLTIAPELLKTRAGYYFRSLAADLQTTEVECLQVLGRQLQVLVANNQRVA
jgi:hypothetical protein